MLVFAISFIILLLQRGLALCHFLHLPLCEFKTYKKLFVASLQGSLVRQLLFASILTSASHIAASAGSCMCLALTSLMFLCKSDLFAWFSSRFASRELRELSLLGLSSSPTLLFLFFCSLLFLFSRQIVRDKEVFFPIAFNPRVSELRKTCPFVSTAPNYIHFTQNRFWALPGLLYCFYFNVQKAINYVLSVSNAGNRLYQVSHC